MAPDISSLDDPIAHMIRLRLQLAELEAQIEALKPAFYDACASQEATQFEQDGAVISRRLTPGRWKYPEDINEQERTLKQLKKEYQETHEPVGGREVIWAVKLTEPG